MTYPGHATILVVEDDMLIRMNSSDTLQHAGYSVIEAESADEAITLLEQADHVELLFSDIDMPGSMDGLDLAATVHRRWPNVRLLLTSGKHRLSTDEIPDHGQFVPKPYSSHALVAQIKGLLVE